MLGFIHLPISLGVAVSSPEKPYKRYSLSKLYEDPLDENIQAGWLSMIQHYFLSAWVPDPKVTYHYYSEVSDNDIYTIGMVSPRLLIPAQKSIDLHSQFYSGPKVAQRLKAVSPHLSLAVDYSSWTILSLLSTWLFFILKYIHKLVGNWGWSIVLLTLLIKLAFYKLSATSYKSMAGMRTLQPKMNALKKRYKDDRQALSKAMMELYKKEKINPVSGCLPILIQIPVFFALYYVLLESVELRHAPFIFWIQDLSVKDPYFILPILMGISMFLQQKLSPKPPDPTQAKVFMFLPIIMTLFFLNFPAGLVLYWFVNNAISILQQWYITKKYATISMKSSSKKTVSKKKDVN